MKIQENTQEKLENNLVVGIVTENMSPKSCAEVQSKGYKSSGNLMEEWQLLSVIK